MNASTSFLLEAVTTRRDTAIVAAEAVCQSALAAARVAHMTDGDDNALFNARTAADRARVAAIEAAEAEYAHSGPALRQAAEPTPPPPAVTGAPQTSH